MLRSAITASNRYSAPLLQHLSQQAQFLKLKVDPSRGFLRLNSKFHPRCLSSSSATADKEFEENEKWQQLREICSPGQLDQTVQNLVDVGYSKKLAEKMVLSHPSVTRVSRDGMQQTLLQLESFGFKTEVRQTIVSDCPTLFFFGTPQLKRNFNDLQNTLGNRDAKSVVTKSPKVLSMNQQVVKRTFEYCIDAMGLKPSAVVNSGILQFDLKFVKLRHSLLEKAGYYRYPELLKKDGTETNPSVSDMFFTSDEKFVSIFSGLSMEDYVVYEELMNSLEDEFDSGDDEDEFDEDRQGKKNYDTLRKRV